LETATKSLAQKTGKTATRRQEINDRRDQRNQVTNRAIDILRTNNAGSEAEVKVMRIMRLK
jgi:hypothetical protein